MSTVLGINIVDTIQDVFFHKNMPLEIDNQRQVSNSCHLSLTLQYGRSDLCLKAPTDTQVVGSVCQIVSELDNLWGHPQTKSGGVPGR